MEYLELYQHQQHYNFDNEDILQLNIYKPNLVLHGVCYDQGLYTNRLLVL